MKLVGIGGLPRCGKDTLAEMFIEAGYFGVSFGDIVRGFARIRHKDKPDPISVANMTDTSNWLRETRGPDVILQEALKQYEAAQKTHDYKGIVLFSVRAPVEVDFILGRGGQLVWVESSDKVRYERAMQNLRHGEQAITLEEFKRQEALQWLPQPGTPAEAQMDISYVKSKSPIILENNGNDVKVFKGNAHKLISSLISSNS